MRTSGRIDGAFSKSSRNLFSRDHHLSTRHQEEPPFIQSLTIRNHVSSTLYFEYQFLHQANQIQGISSAVPFSALPHLRHQPPSSPNPAPLTHPLPSSSDQKFKLPESPHRYSDGLQAMTPTLLHLQMASSLQSALPSTLLPRPHRHMPARLLRA